jgi:SRSO17 transposase
VAAIAGSRWAVDECFQTAKRECGLDDYQVRRYPGWHRHMTRSTRSSFGSTQIFGETPVVVSHAGWRGRRGP